MVRCVYGVVCVCVYYVYVVIWMCGDMCLWDCLCVCLQYMCIGCVS